MMFSVLMSVYYKEKPSYLDQSLQSLFDQTVKPNQVVLVLDGVLSEKIEKVIYKWAGMYHEIELYPLDKNVGLSAALRYGLEKCRNEIVFRMDTDDVCYSNRFEEMLLFFEMHPNLEVAGSFATIINGEGERGGILKVPISENDIYKNVWACPFNHPTVCFKKSALMRIGSYSENPGPRQDDYELWFRVVAGGLKCMNLAKPLLYYRFTSSNIARNNIHVGWARLKVGLKGAFMCKCAPIAYIGVAYPLLRSLMPGFIRGKLYKLSDKFNPRTK